MSKTNPTTTRRRPPLADTLRLMLPGGPTARLLRAALGDRDAAEEAWRVWLHETPDPKAFLASDRVGIKRHLPLLYANLSRHGIPLGRDLEPYLRAARAREEMRSTRYRAFLAGALTALNDAGVTFVCGEGVTVGETVHADPVLRHSHDIDLLVPADAMDAAAAAVEAAGFADTGVSRADGTRRFDHESGLPIELHPRLYVTSAYAGTLDGVLARTRDAGVAGVACRVMSDADVLVHAVAHASTVRQRHGLSWITDSVTLLRCRADGVDGDAVVAVANEAGVALPVFAGLTHLVEAYDAAVPAGTLDRLADAAARATARQRLAVIDGLRVGVNPRLKPLIAHSSPRSKLAMARALLAPPPGYLRERRSELGPVGLAASYLARPASFAFHQANKARHRAACRLGLARPGDGPAERFAARLMPEERLLLALVREDLTADEAGAVVAETDPATVRWEAVMATAEKHGIAPLLFQNLKRCREAGLNVPAAVLARLRGGMFRAITTKEQQRRELVRALDFLADHGFTTMLIKGASLDAAVLETPWHVSSLDIDLMVRTPADRVDEPLRERVYDLNRGPFEADFARHHDLDIDGLLTVDYPGLWADARLVAVEGRAVLVPCPEDMVIASCVNACRKRFFQLKTLYGLRATLAKLGPLDWGRLATKARRYRCRAIVYAGLYVARLAVRADVPDEALRRLGVTPWRAAAIRFLAVRRSFTPITGRQTMSEDDWTLARKRLATADNLSLLLPYTAYSPGQACRRLRWLLQSPEESKPGLMANTAGAVGAEPGPIETPSNARAA